MLVLQVIVQEIKLKVSPQVVTKGQRGWDSTAIQIREKLGKLTPRIGTVVIVDSHSLDNGQIIFAGGESENSSRTASFIDEVSISARVLFLQGQLSNMVFDVIILQFIEHILPSSVKMALKQANTTNDHVPRGLILVACGPCMTREKAFNATQKLIKKQVYYSISLNLPV